MSQLTIGDLYRELVETLTNSLGRREANAAAKIILEDVRDITQTDLAVNAHRTVEDMTAERIRRIAQEINNGKPVQYAIGSARFYGMDFVVTPDVLIPRPETEGLIDMIVKEYANQPDLQILDCGTGSGCIAISLARHLPFANIDAIDISAKALEIAKENGKRLNVKVNFFEGDILTLKTCRNKNYDVIVSNPPYIAEEEASEMDDTVKNYEPKGALFVSNDDPLIFYRAIIEFASTSLNPQGTLYFEINPRFTDEMKQLLMSNDFSDIDIIRDYIGRYRYISAKR